MEALLALLRGTVVKGATQFLWWHQYKGIVKHVISICYRTITPETPRFLGILPCFHDVQSALVMPPAPSSDRQG